MEKTAAISAAKLAAKVGRTLDVIIDEGRRRRRRHRPLARPTRPRSTARSICAMRADLKAGDIVAVEIEDADEHDLFGVTV
jgi:ribosomal protein S12 methylthiotransferase